MDVKVQTAANTSDGAGGATILRLKIDRFRAFQTFDWFPKKGLNVVLGGGDAGKTTILEAIALLLNPSNSALVSDHDYWQRQRRDGFFIGAVISLPPDSSIATQSRPAFPWEWDGRKACAPQESEEGEPMRPVGPPVYKVSVSGSDELDLTYAIHNPNDTTDIFSPTLRREIGLVRLGGDDRNDRDLRLVQGSALDRLLSDKALRSRLTSTFSDVDVKAELQSEGQEAIKQLNATFGERALPHDLGLGLSAGQGQSISALIGLTAAIEDSRLPLSSWGSGTRRLASLAVAQACRSGCPITLVDEAERGLEPYRQRKLVTELAEGPSQVVMTTHGAPALAAAKPATIWYLSQGHVIAELSSPRVLQLQQRDPEAFLSRLTLVGEGPTEVGFIQEVLGREIPTDLLDLGIRLCDGQGNTFTLDLLEEFNKAKLALAAFVDCEGDNTKRWADLKTAMGDLLFQWPTGCTEANVIAHIGDDKLEALLVDPEETHTQPRLASLVERLKILEPTAQFTKHDFATIKAVAGDRLRTLIIAAASGDPGGAPENEAKTWKKHGKRWFKSLEGGRELADKAYALGAMPEVKPQLQPLISALTALAATTSKATDGG
ncbi:putative ATP-dependent endonuclease of OLD family [Rhizobium leguminosarum]|uniref:ATP-dependent endonuclease of OLD family n=1 Tax=Rhizobium leguminosarum TaxID=384 RepID=A0AAE2T064_RHILE|nr:MULTISPECIES: AAA family ATPase [Rhizobium]MBB4293293.1 putative ATP-dependent endonuclease of OLD family [Rhizobium leguminosarum]MBB4296098.1 putative ATP-dependent endonuclease of OLD family [Rhizobium leguminosarum]MBB4311445.1 putative ATP-dependent endonuclease of OLD family [Rhizobium leguminosarum]MBB4420327.1 putative ATP-dependent endonuclease of OLD family [Rhizobium leguminosarum]MBB4435518.1 putative ATP-dependent endonuclease of OLD family [Rhizobium esperanzae]